MQQAEMANLIRTTINANTPAGNSQAKPAEADNQQKNNGGRMLNAAKNIGTTTAFGLASGAAVGGIVSLIPIKDIDRTSNVLCDTFVKGSLNASGLAEEKLPEVSFANASEQLKKAQEYIKAGQVFDNAKLSEGELKTAEQNFSDAVWALKQSAIEYINKAGKEDGLLKFAKKEARKIRTADVMKNSISIGLTTALLVLLFNTITGRGKKDKNSTNTQK